MVKIVELLSPAKDMASLNSAINNGADSVYIGVQGFNMRANVTNFSIDNLGEAVRTCHDSGVKLYVCTNTVIKEDDILELKRIMPIIKSSGVDAVIVSDLGALKIARENGLDIHMSVQANLSNSEALNLLSELGVKRTILSRELSLKDIKEIGDNSLMELEVFVHGSMCVAISGRCFLSSYLYNKSANCGECLQPCRKEWKIVSEDGEELIIDSKLYDQNKTGINDFKSVKTHLLSPKDLCMIEYIPELVKNGINVFKIEGRAKPADYVATVTKIYREAINDYEEGKWNSDGHDERIEKWIQELSKVFNRGFDTGFFLRTPYKISNSNKATSIKKDVGKVLNYYKKVNAAEIKLYGDIELGNEIIIQGSTTGSIIMKITSMQINGQSIDKASKGQNVAIFVKDKVRPNDVVYKRIIE